MELVEGTAHLIIVIIAIVDQSKTLFPLISIVPDLTYGIRIAANVLHKHNQKEMLTL